MNHDKDDSGNPSQIGPGSGEGKPAPRAVFSDDELFSSPQERRGWRLVDMMLLVAGVAIILWLLVIFQAWLLVILIVVLIGFSVGSAVIFARRRATRQDSLLWILAIAAERGMPLAPTVGAFADQYRGKFRGRIMRLAVALNQGHTLPEAFDQVPRIVSRDATLLAHVGQDCGRLPDALRLAASSRTSHLPMWMAVSSRFAYLLALLLSIQSIVGFIIYFIVPKFEAIFKDFGVSLPLITTNVIDYSHIIVKYGFLSFPLVLLEVLLLVFLPFSFTGWVNYDVPFFDRALSRRHTALILRSLGLVVESGRPIEQGLQALSIFYPTLWIRRKLIRVEEEVHHGADWIESLHSHGLIGATDAEALTSGAAVGNLSWVMRELADTGERRLGLRFQALVQTLFPLLVISLGLLVLTLAVAFFSPLVVLIERLGE